MNYINESKTLIVIVGPTAVGKTNAAIHIAQHYNTAIISADARQCFKEMSIGTAKPSKEELNIVKHYFINSHSIYDNVTAAEYSSLARDYLNEIFSNNDVATVCGGTGLYVNALLYGFDQMPDIDKNIESEYFQKYNNLGFDWLSDAITQNDPEYTALGDMKNPHRMLRALIFKLSTGNSIIQFKKGNINPLHCNVIKIGLELPRAVLYDRINKRVNTMMSNGLLDEVYALEEYKHLKNLQTIGYQEFYEYMNGKDDEVGKKIAIEKIKQFSRNYAKRQMTWFKNKDQFEWFDPNNLPNIFKYITSKMHNI